jgi:hypothetical protein
VVPRAPAPAAILASEGAFVEHRRRAIVAAAVAPLLLGGHGGPVPAPPAQAVPISRATVASISAISNGLLRNASPP